MIALKLSMISVYIKRCFQKDSPLVLVEGAGWYMYSHGESGWFARPLVLGVIINL